MRNLSLPLSLAAGLLAASALPTGTAIASDGGDMPLSQLVRPFESEGVAVEADRKRQRWEILLCQRNRVCNEIYVDPVSGRELRREREFFSDPMPPENGLTMSAIAESLEQRKLGTITELDFDSRRWEATIAPAQGSKFELHLDPVSGQIQRCRGRNCPSL